MDNSITERQKLNDEIRRRFPTTTTLHLRFGGCTITVHMNSHPLAEELNRYFKPFVTTESPAQIVITVHEAELKLDFPYTIKQPDPGKTKIKEEYFELNAGRIVHKRLTGMQFIFGHGDNLAIGPCLANSNQVINFINNRFIEWKLLQGSILGHAAGVLHNNRGLALAGFSGMGKSTLALHLMSRGTAFVSNDRLMVEQRNGSLQMSGVAKLPRINPGTILNNPDLAVIIPEPERSRFAALPPDELWALEHKYDADIETCFGKNRFVLQTPMNGLVILNWQRGNGSELSFHEVSLAERRDLLAAFMKSTGLFFLPGDPNAPLNATPETYIEHLEKIPVFEISGSVDFDHAADCCLNFLNKDSS